MQRMFLAGLLVGLVSSLTSCGGGGSVGVAFLRILHNSPDAPAVDIYVGGSSIPLVTNVSYGQSTGFLERTPGDIQIAIRAAGDPVATPPIFLSQTINLADNGRHTIIATGLFNVANDFRIVAERDSLQAPAAGFFRARIYHSSPDAGAVGIDVGDDGSVEIPGLQQYEATGAGGVDLPANTSLLIGIVDDSSGNRLTGFTLPPLPDSAEVIVVASGLVGSRPDDPDGFLLRAAADGGSFGDIQQDPFIYVVHAGPDAPAVNVNLGGQTVVAGASFGQIAGPLQVSPAAYTFDIVPAAGGGSVGMPSTPPLLAGETYLLVATGYLNPPAGGAPFQVVVAEDDLALDANNQRLQVLHVSPDAPTVDVGVVAGGLVQQPPLISSLAFPMASLPPAGLPVMPISNLDLGVAVAGNTAPAATFTISTVPDLRTIVLAAGALTPRPGIDQGFQLLVIDTNSFPWQIASVAPN